jgi:hypothetical protein
MTTEILRNLLYDAAGGEIDVRLDTLGLVIMDESQYLADPERGVVWEETLIFCPSQARLLLVVRLDRESAGYCGLADGHPPESLLRSFATPSDRSRSGPATCTRTRN